MQSATLPCASRAPCWHRATMRALERATCLHSARLPVSPASGRRAGAARLSQQCSRCNTGGPASQAQRLGAAALRLLTGRRCGSHGAATGWWPSSDASCRRCQVCRSVGGSGDGGSAGGGDGGSGSNGDGGSSASGATAAALAAAPPLGGKEDVILLDVTGGCFVTF
jgi:hypothetical protein